MKSTDEYILANVGETAEAAMNKRERTMAI